MAEMMITAMWFAIGFFAGAAIMGKGGAHQLLQLSVGEFRHRHAHFPPPSGWAICLPCFVLPFSRAWKSAAVLTSGVSLSS